MKRNEFEMILCHICKCREALHMVPFPDGNKVYCCSKCQHGVLRAAGPLWAKEQQKREGVAGGLDRVLPEGVRPEGTSRTPKEERQPRS